MYLILAVWLLIQILKDWGKERAKRRRKKSEHGNLPDCSANKGDSHSRPLSISSPIAFSVHLPYCGAWNSPTVGLYVRKFIEYID